MTFTSASQEVSAKQPWTSTKSRMSSALYRPHCRGCEDCACKLISATAHRHCVVDGAGRLVAAGAQPRGVVVESNLEVKWVAQSQNGVALHAPAVGCDPVHVALLERQEALHRGVVAGAVRSAGERQRRRGRQRRRRSDLLADHRGGGQDDGGETHGRDWDVSGGECVSKGDQRGGQPANFLQATFRRFASAAAARRSGRRYDKGRIGLREEARIRLGKRQRSGMRRLQIKA